MQAFAHWLAGTSVSQGIQQALWLIIVLQTVHILAVATVLSSVAMVELRILGVTSSPTLSETAHRFMAWIWAGLAVLAMTGATLIVAEPARTLDNNPAFIVKMLMLSTAIAVTFAFQLSLRRRIEAWDGGSPRAGTARALAILAFVLWCGIAIAGRWIAYVREG